MSMSFDEYKTKVIDLASKELDKIDFKSHRLGICVDTVRESFNKNLPIEDAAKIAADDSLYWAGFYC